MPARRRLPALRRGRPDRLGLRALARTTSCAAAFSTRRGRARSVARRAPGVAGRTNERGYNDAPMTGAREIREAVSPSTSSGTGTHARCRRRPLVPVGDQTLVVHQRPAMVQFKGVFPRRGATRLRGGATTCQEVRWRAGRQSTTTSRERSAARREQPRVSSRCSATSPFGDYFKADAHHVFGRWEFLTKGPSGLDQRRLKATVFRDGRRGVQSLEVCGGPLRGSDPPTR